MNYLLSLYWVLGASLWCFVSGILHTFFVLKEHKGNYNRDLLRLLMDGHVLIFIGILFFVCFLMMQKGLSYGAIIALVSALALVVYCLLIFPFLKSYFTLGIAIIVMLVAIRFLFIPQ
jgi:hypothetical protein